MVNALCLATCNARRSPLSVVRVEMYMQHSKATQQGKSTPKVFRPLMPLWR